MLLLYGVSLALGDVNITASGPPVVVWEAVATLHKCGFIDVPDIPGRAFVDASGVTHMVVGSTNGHPMQGPSPLIQNRSCAYNWNETGDPVRRTRKK